MSQKPQSVTDAEIERLFAERKLPEAERVETVKAHRCIDCKRFCEPPSQPHMHPMCRACVAQYD